MLELFYAVYRKDVKKVMQSLIDLEALQPSGDLTEVKRSVQFFLNNLLRKTPDKKETMVAIKRTHEWDQQRWAVWSGEEDKEEWTQN